MNKLIYLIILLCLTGYLVIVYTDAMKDIEINEIYMDAMKDIEINEIYMDAHYASYIENKNRTITIAEKKEDTSDDQSSKSITSAYNRIIIRKSDKYRLEPSLIKAVIKVESNWNSKAVSQSGAIGLMQLMPTTAKDMDIINPFNPEDNIDGGARYLRYLLDKFNGNLPHALEAYNAGPARVARHKGIPPIKETRQYVERVLSIYNDEKPIDTDQPLKPKI